ncbi:MAG: DUF5916 domain-containing protein [Balneolales bacterium]
MKNLFSILLKSNDKYKQIILFTVLLISIILISKNESLGQSQPMLIPYLNEPIVFDGRVDEPVWDSIDPLPLVSYEPVSGLPPSEATEIRISYDDEYIYASIKAYDADTTGIRINSLSRGRLSGDDLFHILLDTYNDNESAIVFTVTPGGVKWDATISNDGDANSDFSTYWDVVTHVDGRGWFAEVRIPFSSIGFQDEDGRVEMGLLAQRMIARKNERVLFPEVPGDISGAYFKSSLAKKVVFENVSGRRPLHITPFLAGGMEQEYLLNETSTGYSRDDNQKLNAGLDVKYGVTSNLTLDLTVNTDFAQVEADNEQVNLTRFNQSFPEKRQFFQERSGTFDFNTGGGGLFHSRRIGLTEAGDKVRILGGGRLAGRVGSWDLGFLNMQTDKFQDNPSENFGVVRLRRNVINPYSHAGVMGTSRIGMDGSYNLSYGIDGSIRLKGDDYFTYIYAQSIEEETMDRSPFAASRLRLHWERRTREGFAWQSTISRSGDVYNPGAGFINRLDYQRFGQVINYGWMPGSSSPLQWHSLQMSGAVYQSTTEKNIESIDIGPTWQATTNKGNEINTGITWHYENIPSSFNLLGRAEIPTGEYEFIRGVAGYEIASSQLFRTRIQADVGTFYDGWMFEMDLSPSWNISRHLELEASWLYNLIKVPSVEERFASHLGQVRVETALNTHFSTNAFIQLNTSNNIISGNIRLRYNFRDGNDFWIVFNTGMNNNRHRTAPMLPRTDVRTLHIKYTYTFHQ